MKIVAGLSKVSLKSRIIDVAIKNGSATDSVDSWVDWFDGQSCDYSGANDKKRCESCRDKCEGLNSRQVISEGLGQLLEMRIDDARDVAALKSWIRKVKDQIDGEEL